jgi:hypothetical protein
MYDMNNTVPQNGVSLLVTMVTLIIFTLIPVECTHIDKIIIFGVGSNLVGRYKFLAKKSLLLTYSG